MSVQLQRWVFTVDEYDRMIDAGILSEDDRVELIEGELIKMSPIGKRHGACVKRINKIASAQAGPHAIVSVQDPIRLDDYSEPQPDIALLKPQDDFYDQVVPPAESVLLIIEVSDTSLSYDKNVKLPLYAKAGIPEVWIDDLVGDKIETYSNPVNGKYQNSRVVKRGESLSPEKLPMIVFTADQLLG
jgi:Uma2 family endonuclease